MSGITMGGQLYTMVRDRALTSKDSVSFLRHLLRCVGSKLMVIWDGSPIHKGEVREYLTNGGARYIHLEQLPPYAPELNPDEWIWQHLKHVELRNVCCGDLAHLRDELRYAILRLRRKPHVIQACFSGAKLCVQS
jgi:transposase